MGRVEGAAFVHQVGGPQYLILGTFSLVVEAGIPLPQLLFASGKSEPEAQGCAVGYLSPEFKDEGPRKAGALPLRMFDLESRGSWDYPCMRIDWAFQ